jgi:hypothetical protein
MTLNVKPTFLLPILQDLSLHARSLHAAVRAAASLRTKEFTVQTIWKARHAGRRLDWMVLVQQCPREGMLIYAPIFIVRSSRLGNDT